MMDRNRLMVLNAVIVLLTAVLNMALSLVETRLFLEYYGMEINGLIQSGNQILNYIILFESGICSAYMFHMYQSVAQRDNASLSSYYHGFRNSMQKAVIKMLAAAGLISLIYPIFMNRGSLSYTFVSSTLFLLAAKVIMPYQVTLVPRHMIVLKERKYIAELAAGLTNACIYAAEIVIILNTKLSVQMLLICCVIISFSSGMIYQYLMNRLYKKEIQKDAAPDYAPNQMSGDVMVHTVSGLVFGSTDNVILSVLASLNEVTIYSNYMMLIRNTWALITKLMDGATASIGIKIAGNDENSYGVFRELLSAALFLSALTSPVFIAMINNFIELWVGRQFCVGYLNIILFAVILFCNIILTSLQPIVSAGGRFKESKGFMVAQTVVNLILTIVLVPVCGITGALIGTAFARAFISVPCNYKVIYRTIFTEQKTSWWILIKAVLFTSVLCVFNYVLGQNISVHFMNQMTWANFILKAFILILCTLVLSVLFFYISDPSFRKLTERLIRIVRKQSKHSFQ